MQAELVQTKTTDNTTLHGFLARGSENNERVIVVIHGRGGNFYQDPWVPTLQDVSLAHGWDCLTTNNRGHDAGKIYEKLEDCIPDIDAWMGFIRKEGYTKIILAGHSLGTHKIANYYAQNNPKDVVGIIFLSPTDSYRIWKEQVRGMAEDYLAIAREMVEGGKGKELVPKEFYYRPLSARTYFSFYGPHSRLHVFDFHNPDFDFQLLRTITIPVLAITGTKDSYLLHH